MRQATNLKSGTLNLSGLEDKQASEILTQNRGLILRGESYVEQYRMNARRNMRAWRGKLWSDADLAFFKSFDITPYVFRDYRPYLNQLISQQRNSRFKFELVSQDVLSYRRYLEGMDEFVQAHEHIFSTREEAEEYYKEYGDDEFALTVTGFLDGIRNENKAKYTESEVFENGIITGSDFLKCYYGKKHNREGSVVFERKSIREMFWDDNATEYDLCDAEFIGEIHEKYVEELVQMYPQHAEIVRKHFEKYTNKNQATRLRSLDPDYEKFFKWESANLGPQAKIAEIWTLESEERFEVFDKDENTTRIADFGLDEDTIWDNLYQKTLLEYSAQKEMEGDWEALADPNLEGAIQQMAQERYELRATQEPIWYKCVQSYDVLFEYERSPYPHGKHPYTPYFPQFTDGFFSSVMDDIFDLIIGLNKALMFREMMMAHGAKGMLIVNSDVMAQSGYDLNDVASAYTQVGTVMMIKLKPGQRMDNVFLQQSTLDKGLLEINTIIADYDRRLQHITGVTPAQLGMSQGDTPAARYRMQITEGQAANNLIYDNFVRTLEHFYTKAIPLVVELMQTKPTQVIRMLGEQARPWTSLEVDQSFDMFAEALRVGQFTLTVAPIEDNPQTNSARAAQYMQMALGGVMPVETAMKYSNDPNRGGILRDMKKDRAKRAMEDAALMVGIQTVQQLAAESGMDPQAVQEFVTKLQKARYAELQQQEQEQKRVGSQIGAVQTGAMQDARMEAMQS